MGKSKYTGSLTEANITDALTAITAAETAIAAADKTTSTLQNAYTALEAKYNVLATAKANSETSDIGRYYTALQTLYDNTQTLLRECGTVTVSNFALQSTDANAAGYSVLQLRLDAGDGTTRRTNTQAVARYRCGG